MIAEDYGFAVRIGSDIKEESKYVRKCEIHFL
jgi:hypothetical protein